MTLVRTHGWRKRLEQYLLTTQQDLASFDSGRDCVTGFAVGVINAITEVDFSSQVPEFHSLEEARKVLDEMGVSSVGDLLRVYLPEIPVSQANVGDLGVIETDLDFGVGQAVCMFDTGGLVVVTKSGQRRAPRSAAARAFKVGERIE